MEPDVIRTMPERPLQSIARNRKAICEGKWFWVAILAGAMPVLAQSPSPSAVRLTAEQDHQRLLDLLHISELRRGPDGDPKSPNAANVDESKVPPYTLPDPLVLKNGQKVTTADMWWNQRRPEIVEDFDREVLGRVPKTIPKVTWE